MRKNRPRGSGHVRKTMTLAPRDLERLGQIMEAMTDDQGDHPSKATIVSEAIERLWIARVRERDQKPSPFRVGIPALRRVEGRGA